MIKINIHLIAVIFLFSVNAEVFAESVKPRIAVLKPIFSSVVPARLEKIFNKNAFRNEVELAVQATGKFDIISREKTEMKAILAEQAFADSELSSGQAAEKGQMAATNFIVVSEVQSFRFYRKSTPVPNIDDKYKQKDSGSLSVAIKVMDTTTGAVKGSFIVEDRFVTKQRLVNHRGGYPHSSHLERMYEKLAAKMANELIDTVFPMVVLRVKGNSVFINRGKGSGIKKGEKLVVYHAGEALIDPYTGESLGSAEEELGLLKVVDVRPKFTIATPLDKVLLDQILPNDIVRKPSK